MTTTTAEVDASLTRMRSTLADLTDLTATAPWLPKETPEAPRLVALN